MRIVQFRRHLEGYVVRVTDAHDIAILRKQKDFAPLMVVKHVLHKGSRKCYNIVSAEFMVSDTKSKTINTWKKQVWEILKYRKRKGQ
jgi:hypothetical protein